VTRHAGYLFVKTVFVLLGTLGAASCSNGDEIKWTEEVRLQDGKVIQVKRRTELTSGGFPVQKRGFQKYHEVCYAPLSVYWKSKPEYRPEAFEIVNGKPYMKVTLGSFNACRLHGYPETDALYYEWTGTGWKQIRSDEFPPNARLNLLQNPLGNVAANDVRGLVSQREKESRDASVYYSLKVTGARGLNETPPFKGICRRHKVEEPAPAKTTDIFLPSEDRGCE